MSGAQGAKPPEEKTATMYESIEGGENRTRTDLYSQQDQGSIQIDKLQDKVLDPVRKLYMSDFGDTDKEHNKKDKDLGVTGTGE